MVDINNPGSTSIVDVELEIGGQKIDKHTGHGWKSGQKINKPNPSGKVGIVAASGANTGGTVFQNNEWYGGIHGRRAAQNYLSPYNFGFAAIPVLPYH